jgi:hypothetical protein
VIGLWVERHCIFFLHSRGDHGYERVGRLREKRAVTDIVPA